MSKCSYVTHLASHLLLGSWVKTDGNRNICYYFYPLICSSICYKWTRGRTAMDCVVFPSNLSGLLWDLVYLKVFSVLCYVLQHTACLMFLQVRIQTYALHAKNKWLQRAWRECWRFQAMEQVPKDSAKQGRGSHGTWASLLELSRRTTQGERWAAQPLTCLCVRYGGNVDLYHQPQVNLHLSPETNIK